MRKLGQCPVIISVTSLPSRIARIRLTLVSLLSGVKRPDKVFVSLPYYSARERSEYIIPDFLTDRDFCSDIVEVVRVNEDFGPGTKLLGPLPSLSENSCIIVVDDDAVYRRTFLHNIADAQLSERDASFSYFTYTVGGIKIGQGCDGFSFWEPNLRGITEFFRKYVHGTNLVLHDDFWSSMFLATRDIRVKSISHLIGPYDTIYQQSFEDEGSLRYLAGEFARDVLQRAHFARLLKEVEMPTSVRIRLQAGFQAEQLIVSPARRLYRKALHVLATR